MCGRFALDMKEERLALLFSIDEVTDSLPPRYNIAPGQPIAVIGMKPDGKRRGLAKLQWGLVPRWANDLRSGPRPINARAESVLDRPLFRDSFHTRRCLIPASGFFEWKTSGKKKQPYYIRRNDHSPMAFAGLWDIWTDGTDKLITCCIITVAANDRLKLLHERMPAILPPEDFSTWLARETPVAAAHGLLKSSASDVMEYYPVGPEVNKVANDGPECIAPLPASRP